MAVISGKFAECEIDGCNVLEFESAELTYGTNVEEYNSRAGAGSRKTVAGVNSGSGTLTGFFDPSDSLLLELTSGALVAVILRESATGKKLASGNARLGQFNVPEFNRAGQPVKVSIPFVTDGAWSFAVS